MEESLCGGTGVQREDIHGGVIDKNDTGRTTIQTEVRQLKNNRQRSDLRSNYAMSQMII